MPRLSIDSHYLTDQLKALLRIPSPTGYTDTIVRHVTHELQRLGLRVELTPVSYTHLTLPTKA